MISTLLATIIYLAIAIFFLAAWNKYKAKGMLWMTWMSACIFFLELSYLLLLAFNASQEIVSLVLLLTHAFDIFVLIAVVIIIVRYYTSKRRKE